MLKNEIILEPLSFIQCSRISLLNCIFISDALAGLVAVTLNQCTDVIIRDCKFSGNNPIYAYKSKDLVVDHNTAYDITGKKPRGQFFQANGCMGPITVQNNTISNTDSKVIVEDFINLFKTFGAKETPCLIRANTIYGNHGTSTTGGGIMLGDNGGSWQEARDNLLINAGQYGVAVAGGRYMRMVKNKIYGQKSSISNVGCYVWAQKDAVLSDVLVEGNMIDYTNKRGLKNPFWLGGDAKAVTTVRDNNFEWVYMDALATLPKETKDPQPPKKTEDIDVVIEKKARCTYKNGVCVSIELI